MLKYKCPKCGQELGYKFNLKLYRRGYHCTKCRVGLQTTFNLSITLFLTFFIGLTISDYILKNISVNESFLQFTDAIVSLAAMVIVWIIVSTIMPRTIKIAGKGR
jgi:hypothetical protein